MQGPDGKLHSLNTESEAMRQMAAHPERTLWKVGEVCKVKGRKLELVGIADGRLIFKPLPY